MLRKKYGEWTVEGTYSKDTKFSQYQLEGQKYNYKVIS